MPVTGGLLLGIRLRFHNHAPQKLAIGLALHQQAADEVGGDHLGRAGEEALGGMVWEGLVAMGVDWSSFILRNQGGFQNPEAKPKEALTLKAAALTTELNARNKELQTI